MKRTGAAGASRERQVRAYFRQRGFFAVKVSDSAICDVVAIKRSLSDRPIVYLIEVKANASGGPYCHFRKPERQALANVAEQAGATPLLCHWPPRGVMRLIGPEEWPVAA